MLREEDSYLGAAVLRFRFKAAPPEPRREVQV